MGFVVFLSGVAGWRGSWRSSSTTKRSRVAVVHSQPVALPTVTSTVACESGRVGSGCVGLGRVGLGRRAHSHRHYCLFLGLQWVGSGRVGSGRVGLDQVRLGRIVGSCRVWSALVG
ncbi:hypothetical protein ACOMHN_030944 [Nucella lapillus]